VVKKALDSRKFLHVTWLNIYRHDFIRKHNHFEPGLRHQDIPWTTEVLLAAERVQYTSERSTTTTFTLHRCRISRTMTTR
jgi:hypothetical protein